jgi:hypothetical protein
LGSKEPPQILQVLCVRFILQGRKALHWSEQYQARQGDRNSLPQILQVYVFRLALSASRLQRSSQYFFGLPTRFLLGSSPPQNPQPMTLHQKQKAARKRLVKVTVSTMLLSRTGCLP